LALDEVFKKKMFASLLIHDVSKGFKSGEMGDHCSFSVIGEQVASPMHLA